MMGVPVNIFAVNILPVSIFWNILLTSLHNLRNLARWRSMLLLFIN